eukprot:6202425-Pleurochrysis_carterae.AAC.1
MKRENGRKGATEGKAEGVDGRARGKESGTDEELEEEEGERGVRKEGGGKREKVRGERWEEKGRHTQGMARLPTWDGRQVGKERGKKSGRQEREQEIKRAEGWEGARVDGERER